MRTPEERARQIIDKKLTESGWVVQSRDEVNLSAGLGVIVCEYPLAGGQGYADYMIFVDGKPVGALEAKPEGYPVRSVEIQTDKYTIGLAYDLKPPVTRSRSATSARAQKPSSGITSIRIRAAERSSSSIVPRLFVNGSKPRSSPNGLVIGIRLTDPMHQIQPTRRPFAHAFKPFQMLSETPCTQINSRPCRT